jgi:hypothetical protein
MVLRGNLLARFRFARHMDQLSPNRSDWRGAQSAVHPSPTLSGGARKTIRPSPPETSYPANASVETGNRENYDCDEHSETPRGVRRAVARPEPAR